MSELNSEARLELTQRELAQLFGYSAAWVVAAERDGLPSLGDRGRERYYDAAACLQWHLAREIARRGGADPDRRRLVTAQANRAELELAKRAGELVLAEGVRKAARETGRQIGEAMMRIPAQVAPIIAPNDHRATERLLDGWLRRALSAVADELERPDDVSHANADDGPPPG